LPELPLPSMQNLIAIRQHDQRRAAGSATVFNSAG
jgi:hypothetical protein